MGTKTLNSPLPYRLLFFISMLIMFSGFFLKAGIGAIVLWALVVLLCIALFVREVMHLAIEQQEDGLDRLLAVSFVVVFLVGEFGASTDSRLSFAVSIWRVGMFALFCFVLHSESLLGHPTFRKIANSSLGAYFGVLLAFMVIALLAQGVVGGYGSLKGIVRCVTYYGAMALALYCAVSLTTSVRTWSALRTAFRVSLLVLIILACVEMLTGFHLPTSWLLSDSPAAQAKLEAIGDPSHYITATGPCYNPNNFCLLLAILAAMSLPTSSESPTRKRLGAVLFYLTLTIVAMLGSTIVSLGMVVGCVAWCFGSHARFSAAFFRIGLALLCMLVIADGCLGVAERLVSCRAQEPRSTVAMEPSKNAETVSGDFSVQLKNYENGGGSMWMRITLYKEELFAILENPLGVGPGGIQSYFEENPSKSKLVDPHNWLFEFALSYGVFSAVSCLALFAALLVALGRLARDGRMPYATSLFASLLAMGIGSFAPSSSDFNTLLWIPVILGLALAIQAKSSSNEACASSRSARGAVPKYTFCEVLGL